MEKTLAASELVALSWSTITGFLRLNTSRFVMDHPLAISDALPIVRQWIEQPLIRVIRPGERHWTILEALLNEARLGGNLVSVAELASLAIEHDCKLCSTDNDFACFKKLRWRNPLLSR